MTGARKPPAGHVVAVSADLMAKVLRGRLHVRSEKMQHAFTRCRANPADDTNWLELQRLLQALAEAAGTFGCDALGEQAGLITMLLGDMVAERAQPGRYRRHGPAAGHAGRLRVGKGQWPRRHATCCTSAAMRTSRSARDHTFSH